VHNALQEANALGVTVHAVQGRGYRLAEPLSWLDKGYLAERLSARAFNFLHFDHLPSTNAFLLQAAQAGAPHRTVVTTEWQTSGRGRRGRSWHAALGNGLAFSVLWRSGRPAAELSGLSLAVGTVLVQALQGLGLARARVKWPNDVVVADEDLAKLAGVLIELSGDMLGPSTAVIGVGLNIRGGPELTRAVGQAVTDLAGHLGAVDRNEVLLTLLVALDDGLARFEQAGFAAFQQEWEACHAFHERSVVMLTGQGEQIAGRALGVDAHGALLVQTQAGVRRFHSGEVSLRGAGA
jgi:BirA family biotin operon repressor/biotin-[acetyl-CoA-carboxylase] ligase